MWDLTDGLEIDVVVLVESEGCVWEVWFKRRESGREEMRRHWAHNVLRAPRAERRRKESILINVRASDGSYWEMKL